MSTLFKLRRLAATVVKYFDEIKINQGLILTALNAQKTSTELKDHEFKVFSQWGEDGVIQHLTRTVEIRNKTFIEFGIENFSESNCRFLMMKDDWQGFVIDGSAKNIRAVKAKDYYWQHELTAVEAFVTRDNINALLQQSRFDADLGILSIDIDGNDYHVLEAIAHYRPRILICEYNAVFGPQRKISVPYDERFNRTEKHHSNLYFGASLAAMTHLAHRRGYTLVGTTRAGANAFFVRDDLMNDRLASLTAAAAYQPSRVRESRNERGELTYLAGDDRLAALEGLPVLNVETGELEAL